MLTDKEKQLLANIHNLCDHVATHISFLHAKMSNKQTVNQGVKNLEEALIKYSIYNLQEQKKYPDMSIYYLAESFITKAGV